MKYSIALLSSALLLSCSGNNPEKSAEKTPEQITSQQPTANQTDSNINSNIIKTDQPAKSATNVELAAFEVKGPVKYIFTTSDIYDAMLTKFTENGHLAYRMSDIRSFQINVSGNDVCLAETPDGSTCYKVENGRLTKCVSGDGPISVIMEYIYDGNQLKKIHTIEDDEASNEHSEKDLSVELLETDAHGNWIRRKVGNKVQTREISYYGEAETISPFNVDKMTYRFQGRIGSEETLTFYLQKKDSHCILKSGKRDLSVASYNAETGKLVVNASLKGKHIGAYEGTLNTNATPFTYKGVFTNVNGGKVDFDLHLEGPLLPGGAY